MIYSNKMGAKIVTQKKQLIIIWGLAILLWIGAVIAYEVWANTPVHAIDKYDGDCSISGTVGRCADKCPNQTDTLLGFDKQTGAAICKLAPSGCAYGDSIPLGPGCDKHAPVVPADEYVPSATPPQFGK